MLSTLPWSPKPEAKPRAFKLSKERRAALVDTVADILRDGEPTRFALEGAVRHGVRSALCLSGWPWLLADTVAADLLVRALNHLGAVRPTWEQGQPEWTGDAVYCGNPNCRKPLIREPGRYGKLRFCCAVCRTVTLQAKWRADHREEAVARSQAWRALKRAQMPLKPCGTCGKLFRPMPAYGKHVEQRFCSPRCYPQAGRNSGMHAWSEWSGKATYYKPAIAQRPCEHCGTIFAPESTTGRFCGVACRNRWIAGQRKRDDAGRYVPKRSKPPL